MVFPVVGGNESKGYEISNSLRFNDGDSPSLARTPSSEGNRDTFTISFWLKRSVLGTRQFIINSWGGSTNDYAQIEINTSDKIVIQNIVSNSQQLDLRTNRVFRDPSAWYHIVLAVDSTQGTASNRAKFYVNGVQETSFSTETYMSQNNDTYFNDDVAHYIGKRGDNSNYLDGYLTEFHMVDGAAKAPTDFGEFDDNGVWIPKKYTGTYGTNGFFLQFKQTGTSANASGIGADTSGNTHHWTPANLAATDITEDTCTNNFATFNPLFVSRFDNDGTFLEGNCQRDFTDNANRGYGMSTIGVTSGKWYWEIKVIGSDVSRIGIGVGYDGLSVFTSPFYDNNPSLGMHFYSSASVSANGSTQSYGSAASANDIFMYALDMDNHLIWLGVNGSWFNSATVTEIQNSTATNDITTKLSSQTFLNSGEPVFPMVNDLSTTGASQFQINFGNPPFSISSGNTDGKYGNFEYAPPSGFYALCTKRLAEFG
jgi:hypothetical protein